MACSLERLLRTRDPVFCAMRDRDDDNDAALALDARFALPGLAEAVSDMI